MQTLKRKNNITVGDVIITAVIIFFIIITAYPFIYVISMSLSSPIYVLSKDVYFLPKGFSLKSYWLILQQKEVITAFMNTIWYTVVGTAMSLSLTFMTAYVLSRPTFFLRRQLMFLMTLTMFISGGLIPLYILVSRLGLYNSRWAIILPYVISAYNLIITRSFLETIPNEISEAAKIDGAGEFRIMTQIFFPLAKPIIAVLLLFYGVGYWNSYFAPLIFLTDQNLQPIQLYLRSLLINNGTSAATMGAGNSIERILLNEQLKYSCIVIACFPITIMYPFVQKYFEKGIMIGSVKA